jgi:hypothetical protein
MTAGTFIALAILTAVIITIGYIVFSDDPDKYA